MTEFSGDECVIRLLDNSRTTSLQWTEGTILENLKDDNLKNLQAIGSPDSQELQPVRNVLVDQRMKVLDQKLDQLFNHRRITTYRFDEYEVAMDSNKINTLYNSSLDQLIYLRKQIDA